MRSFGGNGKSRFAVLDHRVVDRSLLRSDAKHRSESHGAPGEAFVRADPCGLLAHYRWLSMGRAREAGGNPEEREQSVEPHATKTTPLNSGSSGFYRLHFDELLVVESEGRKAVPRCAKLSRSSKDTRYCGAKACRGAVSGARSAALSAPSSQGSDTRRWRWGDGRRSRPSLRRSDRR